MFEMHMRHFSIGGLSTTEVGTWLQSQQLGGQGRRVTGVHELEISLGDTVRPSLRSAGSKGRTGFLPVTLPLLFPFLETLLMLPWVTQTQDVLQLQTPR